MAKPRYKTTNWKHYNQVLINRGSLTFWIDEEAVKLWKQINQGNRGRSRLFSDLAISTALMVKRVFSLPLRGLQGFINSILSSLNYRCHALIIHALANELKRSTSRSRQKLKEQSSIWQLMRQG